MRDGCWMERGMIPDMSSETIYIKADQNVEVKKPDVTIGDVVQMECTDASALPKIKTLKLLKFAGEASGKKDSEQRRTVVSVLKIIECIHKEYPNMEVQNLGAPDIIVTYEDQQTPGKLAHGIKTAAVVCITFAGAAFSIMSFNNDVDVSKLFSQIYRLVTGTGSDGFTVLEFTYCIGLIIGILVFFNHFGKKRFSVDPTPMEVEMRLYENDIQTTLVETYSRKEKELDVGTTDRVGGHRT